MHSKKLLPGRAGALPDTEIEGEAVEVFKNPVYRVASKHLIGLLEHGYPDEQSRARDLKMCGRRPAVVAHKNGSVFQFYRARCRQRFCPFCQALNAAEVRYKIAHVVKEREALGKRYSMSTLTFQHYDGQSLRQRFNMFTDALGKFTRAKAFTNHVTGWARGIEVTHGPNGFHPHAHFIIEARYWDVRRAHKLWARCVREAGGPEVPFQSVDLFEIRGDAGHAVSEALGYPFKAVDLSNIDREELRELRHALKNRHLIQPCRAWGIRGEEMADYLKDVSEKMDADDGVTRVAFVDLMRQSHKGETRVILMSLLELLKLDADFSEICVIIRVAVKKRSVEGSGYADSGGWS